MTEAQDQNRHGSRPEGWTPPASMAAWFREDYGSADGVRLVERVTPRPWAGEVLLRVRATSLNSGDVRLLLGDPLLVRLVYGLIRPRFPVRGLDVAGTVVATGEGVSTLQVGDEVVGELPGGGGLAAFAVAPADRMVHRPSAVDAVTAACLPVAAGTAWQAWELAGPDAQRVLVLGASGGVGTFAVQLGTDRGAEVWASCAPRSHDLVTGLGAAQVLDHRSGGAGGAALDALPAGHFDAVLDVAGGIPVRRLQRLIREGGRVVLVTGDGGRVLGPVPRMIRAALCSLGSRRRVLSLAAVPQPEVLRALLTLVAEGRIAPVVEREWPFEAAAEALAHLSEGHARGKNVVRAAREEVVPRLAEE